MIPWVKRLIGVLCHIPLCYIPLHIIILLSTMLAVDPRRSLTPVMPAGFLLTMFLTMIVGMIYLALLVFYLLWVLKGSAFTSEEKIVWSIGVFILGIVVMPVLYWFYIRKIPPGPYFIGAPLS